MDECDGLENRRCMKASKGSNPLFSLLESWLSGLKQRLAKPSVGYCSSTSSNLVDSFFYTEVAQLGRALGLDPRGRRFESCFPY